MTESRIRSLSSTILIHVQTAFFSGPAEFDEEKISLTSATGPASDISAGSCNSNEVKSLGASIQPVPYASASTASGAASTASIGNNSSGRKTSRLLIQNLTSEVGSSMTSLNLNWGQSLRSSLNHSKKSNSKSLLNLFNSTNLQNKGNFEGFVKKAE